MPWRHPGGIASPPSFVATHATGSGGTTTRTMAEPIGTEPGDVILLFVESANEIPAFPITGPPVDDGWQQLTSIGIGTPADVNAVGLEVFWARAHRPTAIIPDRGDHAFVTNIGIRGCVPTGNPWHAFDTFADQKQPGVPFFTPHLPSSVGSLFTVGVFAHALDLAGPQFSGFLGYHELTNVTERFNGGTASGNGGGIAIVTGDQIPIGASRFSAEIADGAFCASFIISLRME